MTSKVQAKISAISAAVFGFIAWLATVPPEQQSGILGTLSQAFPTSWQPTIALWSKLFSVSAFFLLFSGCATTQPGSVPVDNAATRTGQNLVSIVSTAMQDYADANQNGVASLWSISKGLNAYHQIVKTTDDIKQLIVDWKATKGDTLANRITRLLNDSDASPATKALVVAKAAATVAANKGP